MIQDKHTRLLPKLRFPEFHNSKEWETTNLGEIANFLKGKFLPKSALSVDGSYPCIHYGELFTIYSEVITAIISRTDQNENVLLSNKNDVLMPTSDVTPNGLAKACCIKLDNVILGGDILVIRTDKQEICGEFLSRSIRHMEQKVLQYVTGTTVYHLYANSLKLLPLSFPEPEEQKKIADCLGSLDDLIVAEESKLELLRKHKQGLIQQLFPQSGETTPRLRFPEFRDAGKWETKKLGEFVSRGKETFSPWQCDSTPYSIELENIESKTGRILGVVELEKQNSLKSRFQAGDVLFGKLRPYLQKFARPNFQGVCSTEIWVLRSKEVSNAFLFHLVQTERFIQMANISTGSRMPRAEWNFLANAKFQIPYPNEQQRIADCIGSLEAKIEATEQKFKALRQHKQGLMQQLFLPLGNH